jgi:hypothetical protein
MLEIEFAHAFYRTLANIVIAVHFSFVIFVGVGGFMALRWRRMPLVHVPVVIWAALIEFIGWTCPLTPLENHFRELAGLAAYEGSFIENRILSLLYPVDYTMGLRIALGLLAIGLNVVAYAFYLWPLWKRRTGHDARRPAVELTAASAGTRR